MKQFSLGYTIFDKFFSYRKKKKKQKKSNVSFLFFFFLNKGLKMNHIYGCMLQISLIYFIFAFAFLLF